MLDRAYSLISIKSLDDEQRVIRGVATTPTVDRGDDIVEPFGVKFRNPLPFILHHDKSSPVGEVSFDRPTKAGIAFTARIPKVVEPGRVRDRVDEAWHSAKYGLLKGVSIGYIPRQFDRRPTGGLHLKEIEVVELSMVAVPMNAETTILQIKSLDDAYLAAPGTRARVPSQPGVSGAPKVPAMTYSEQIAAEKADLQTKSARLEALMSQEDTQGGLSDDETKERDALTGGIQAQTKKIDRLSALEAAMAAQGKAVSVDLPTGPVAAKPRVEVVNLPKGTLFARYAMAVAAGKGSYSDTLAYARKWDGQTPQVAAYIKAVAGTSVIESPGWGGELVNQNTLATEFVELLMPATIIGRVPGFRNVPFNIPIVTQTGGSTFAWVGETGSKPVGELAFTRTSLLYNKVAGIVVLSEELVRFSRPGAEETVRRDLVDQCAKFLDESFIQVAKAVGANNPASITNGVTSPAASGTTLSDLQYDLNVAIGTLETAGVSTDGLVIVTTPTLARGISMLTNPLGQAPNGFNVTPNGGTLLGYPVIVSSSVDSGVIVIFKPSEIFLADDGRVTLDASNQATLDMDGGSPATATFSLWQNNCVGLRAERFITWAKRRAGAVAVIDTASYGPSVGSP
jgi:HK97 family phage major capsid protein